MTSSSQNRSKVFVSYSHKDEIVLHRLRIHLKPLERVGLLEVWADTNIRPGRPWRQEISTALSAAEIAILLVSPDFLASDFIVDNELPPLLKQAATDGARILPIIVSPCLFELEPELSAFQAINSPNRPLSSMTEHDREDTLMRVAKTIIEHLNPTRKGQKVSASSVLGMAPTDAANPPADVKTEDTPVKPSQEEPSPDNREQRPTANDSEVRRSTPPLDQNSKKIVSGSDREAPVRPKTTQTPQRNPASFDDVFSDIFGDMFRSSTRQTPAARGEDVRIPISLELRVAALGGDQEVTVLGQTMQVKIPAGVDTGAVLRLKGRGRPGATTHGDAFLDITVMSDPVFSRVGDDLHVDLGLHFDQAALGCTVDVPTLEGHLSVKVPPGTASGTRFRIKGEGTTRLKKPHERGDLYAVIRILVPPSLPPRARDLLLEFAALTRDSKS